MYCMINQPIQLAILLCQVCAMLLRAGANAGLRDSSGRRPQDVDQRPSTWDIWKAGVL
jgi:hypothetical protein